MIGIAGYVAGVAILDFSGSMGEAVPDRFAFGIFFPRPFDLVSCRGCAPEKILWEWNLRGRIKLHGMRAGGHRRTRCARCIRHTATRKQSGRESGCNAGAESRLHKFTAGQAQSKMCLLQK